MFSWLTIVIAAKSIKGLKRSRHGAKETNTSQKSFTSTLLNIQSQNIVQLNADHLNTLIGLIVNKIVFK